MTDRFFIEHGMIHDRDTGKHVTTDGEPPFDDGIQGTLTLLNNLENALREKPRRGNYEGRHPTDYTDEDMAAVGRAFMDAIDQARMADPWVKDWSPSQCPSEIIFQLINRVDEAQGLAVALSRS